MIQDFASYSSTQDLEPLKAEITEWAPDFPSLILRVLTGIFVTILGFKIVEDRASQTMDIETPTVEKTEDKPFVFEFYEELKVYEALPVDEK